MIKINANVCKRQASRVSSCSRIVGMGYDIFISADLRLISPPSRLLLFVWSPGGDAHGPSQHFTGRIINE